MPGDRPHQSPTASVLMHLRGPGHFVLRTQLLTRVSAPPWVGLARQSPALFKPSVSCSQSFPRTAEVQGVLHTKPEVITCPPAAPKS
jgi:hypothetical protein